LIENWYWYLTGQHREPYSTQYEAKIKRIQRFFGLLPGAPRCFECHAPMSGLSAWLFKSYPSSFNPNLCNNCEVAMRKEEAGTEVELSMLFADIRGSTTLAESTSTSEFKSLIQRFYRSTTDVLVKHNAMVNRLMGDQVIGLFVPRFAGSTHAKTAIEAALDILRATGHQGREGPWIPVGAGVHTGTAYVGAVGTGNGVNEIAVLGSAPNITARLSSQAADGEVLISETAVIAAGLSFEGVERRELSLKGISQPVRVRVLRLEAYPDRSDQ
jgi:adenylate cyclase